MAKECSNCGQQLDKKAKICVYCGKQIDKKSAYTSSVNDYPTKTSISYEQPKNIDTKNIKVISKGKVLRRIYQLIVLISIIGLAIYTPPHFRELERTTWVDPTGDLYFPDSTRESVNLFFERDHTYRIELFARASGAKDCEMTSDFSIQDPGQVLLHSVTLLDKDKGSTDSEGYSSCASFTSTRYTFSAIDDLWLLVNMSIIETKNTSWYSVSLQIYQDPKEYSTPEIQNRFIVFLLLFFITFIPYVIISMFKLMRWIPQKLGGDIDQSSQ